MREARSSCMYHRTSEEAVRHPLAATDMLLLSQWFPIVGIVAKVIEEVNSYCSSACERAKDAAEARTTTVISNQPQGLVFTC